MRYVLALVFLIGCGGELTQDDYTVAPACAVPNPECGYYPEAGEYLTPCVDDAGLPKEHDGMLCFVGHNRNDTLGLQCNYNCGTGTSCEISRDKRWAVANCGDC